MTAADLRKDLKTKKPILGSERTIKELKTGNLNKIYLFTEDGVVFQECILLEVRNDSLHDGLLYHCASLTLNT